MQESLTDNLMEGVVEEAVEAVNDDIVNGYQKILVDDPDGIGAHGKALLVNATRGPLRAEQPRVLRIRDRVNVGQNFRRCWQVALITQRAAGEPLHHQYAEGQNLPRIVAEQCLRCPSAGCKLPQGIVFIDDLMGKVHLAPGIDSQHQLPPCRGMGKAVVYVVFSLSQRREVQLSFVGKPQFL